MFSMLSFLIACLPCIASTPNPGDRIWREQIISHLQVVKLECKEASGFVRFMVHEDGSIGRVLISSDVPIELWRPLTEAIDQTPVKGKRDKWYFMEIQFTDSRCDPSSHEYRIQLPFTGDEKIWPSKKTLECIYLKPLTIAF